MTDINGNDYSKKYELLKKSEISIWLDVYDDIFSDFDPRPYAERALSDDFLKEAQKVSKEKASGANELKLLIPAHLRKAKTERIIVKRLHEYFINSHKRVNRDIKIEQLKGIILIIFAGIILSAATFISLAKEQSPMLHFSLVLLEPAGWFTIWHGFDNLFFNPASKKTEAKFYKKMSQCDIRFISC